MRILLAACFISVLYTLDFRNSFSKASDDESPQLTEEDIETVGLLKNWAIAARLDMLQTQNRTLYAMAKSLVDHKIADNVTLEWAEEITNEWERHLPRELPYNYTYKSLLEECYETYLSEERIEKKNLYNTWTNGEFEVIFKAFDDKRNAFLQEMENEVKKTYEKLSEKPKEFYRYTIELSNSNSGLSALGLYILFDKLVTDL